MTEACYALRCCESKLRIAQWHVMEGFFVGDWTYESLWEDPDGVPSPRLEVSLKGLEVLTDLTPYLDEEDGSYSFGDADVEVLDARGDVVGTHDVWGTDLEVGPQGTGTLWANAGLAPHRGEGVVWEQWRSELPREKGLWTALPPGDREGWMSAAMTRYFRTAFLEGRRHWPMPEGDIVLDGQHVTDLASLFCAIGEAFNGPGGYFGSNFTALDDCSNWLVRPRGRRLSMVWTDIAIAERALAAATGYPDTTFFDIAVSEFARHDIDIIRS
jgi:hypothetical protein